MLERRGKEHEWSRRMNIFAFATSVGVPKDRIEINVAAVVQISNEEQAVRKMHHVSEDV